MRPVQQGSGHSKYAPPATLAFKGTRATDVSAVLNTSTPTLDECLRDVWLVVAKVMPTPPSNIAALEKALDAIEPRVLKIYKQAAAPLLNTIGEYCSYCESYLGALAEVEHAAPKSEFPLFAASWTNFLLACGPCNTSKLNHPSRADLVALRSGVDLDPDENVSYQELRQTYIDWPDSNSQIHRLIDYRLERLDSAGNWQPVPAHDAADLANRVRRTDFSTGEVFADLPITGLSDVQVRLQIESATDTVTRLIDYCKLNNPSATNPAYDRREMHRTIAWFEILETLDGLQANAAAFAALWRSATMHARNLGFYTLWVKLLSNYYDPSGRPLADRFVHDTASNFPGTDLRNLP
jgi:5-methylcytosine-specific restriction endonuclease McrA